jgi:hypothetical protein
MAEDRGAFKTNQAALRPIPKNDAPSMLWRQCSTLPQSGVSEF